MERLIATLTITAALVLGSLPLAADDDDRRYGPQVSAYWPPRPSSSGRIIGVFAIFSTQLVPQGF